MTLAYLTVVVSSVMGWSDLSVHPSRGDREHASFQRTLAGLDRPSERTMEVLKRYDVDRRYRRDVPGALATLEKITQNEPTAELVYSLAELSWIEGRHLDRRRKAEAIDRYTDAVAYAFDFLFEPEFESGRQPADPRFRMACDLYNGGLDRLIQAAEARGKIMPEDKIKLKVHGKEQVLNVSLHNSPWSPSDVDQIILASDYEVSGLNTQSLYQYGLGVPLIGIHKPDDPGKNIERFYPPEMAFPLTAFLTPNSRLRDFKGDVAQPRDCTLMLVDPVSVRKVGSAPGLPVEADLTTPLAYMWSRTDLDRYRWTGLLRPGAAMGRANLMLLRPYEKGKIPVVMVHGLISTPLAWIPMLNDLLSQPMIREKYQFMLYMYPTGVPVPIAAAGLRETLLQAKAMYDPDGSDPAFEKMVLLGHSMGGLLSHAMAVDSGDKFWRLNSDRNFAEVIGPPEVLGTLKRFLFFEHLPFVKRVVFLATPHRGSDLSRNVIGRVSSNLISEPDDISELLAKLIKDNPDFFDRRQFRRMPTSIDSLDNDHAMLLALLAMTPAPDVLFHSIIGAKYAGPADRTSDGVVSYRSSHLDGVESERIVRSDHGVQKDPEAVLEVRRILLKHIGIVHPQMAERPPSPSLQPANSPRASSHRR